MILNRDKFLAVLMAIGALNAAGCRSGSDASSPEGITVTQTPAAPANENIAAPVAAPVAPASLIQPAAPVSQLNRPAAPAYDSFFRPVSYSPLPPPTVPAAEPPCPPQRVENPGRRPSANHDWTPGSWRWNGKQHSWITGRWEIRLGPSRPPPPARFENPGRAPRSSTVWVPGHWQWSGSDYIWVGGRWDTIRQNHTFVHGHWDKHQNGRWQWVPGYWKRNK